MSEPNPLEVTAVTLCGFRQDGTFSNVYHHPIDETYCVVHGWKDRDNFITFGDGLVIKLVNGTAKVHQRDTPCKASPQAHSHAITIALKYNNLVRNNSYNTVMQFNRIIGANHIRIFWKVDQQQSKQMGCPVGIPWVKINVLGGLELPLSAIRDVLLKHIDG